MMCEYYDREFFSLITDHKGCNRLYRYNRVYSIIYTVGTISATEIKQGKELVGGILRVINRLLTPTKQLRINLITKAINYPQKRIIDPTKILIDPHILISKENYMLEKGDKSGL